MTERFTWERIWTQGDTSDGWSHSGICVDHTGAVVFAAPEGGALIRIAPTGEAERIAVTLTEIHGISVDAVQTAVLWLADPGEKPCAADGYRPVVNAGRVVALRDGVEHELAQPRLPAYRDACWRPTSVVADADGVWVADGYGASLVHRFDRDGAHLLTLDGTATGTAFECPHGVALVTRAGARELWVADRGNRRIVRLTAQGEHLGTIEHPLFTSPSSLAVRGAEVLVTELFGGLLAIDADDQVRSLFPERAASGHAAPWPNALEDGRLVRPELGEEQLHAPHGVVVAEDGSILLTEWLIGGRQWRLVPGLTR
jgi:sugar lactone lactonase YvrE